MSSTGSLGGYRYRIVNQEVELKVEDLKRNISDYAKMELSLLDNQGPRTPFPRYGRTVLSVDGSQDGWVSPSEFAHAANSPEFGLSQIAKDTYTTLVNGAIKQHNDGTF